METEQLIKMYRKRVNVDLEKFFDREIRDAEKISPEIANVLQNLKEFSSRGGKRLRSILSIFGYKMCGGADDDSIVSASISLELLQNYLLIHDDIMDQAKERRGGKAYHVIYEDLHKKKYRKGSPSKFGTNIAIIAGDLCEALGIKVLMHSNFSTERKLKAIEKYAYMTRTTGYGQILDCFSQQLDTVSEEDILKIQQFKTAVYSFEGPLHIGAIFAGANESDLKILSDFAIPTGIAFQIHDDILGLGLYGNLEKIGKPTFSDLTEGKQTLLILKAIQQGNNAQRKIICSTYGKSQITKEQIKAIRKVIIETGSYDYSRKLATKLVNQGKDAIEKSHFNREWKDRLIEIADLMIKRKY